MPTPDLTPYVDLTFFDKDSQDVFDAAMLDLQTKLPDWTPREGNVEVLLLEALSLAVAEAIFAANRLPGAVVQALLKLYGVYPDVGHLPTATLTFTVVDGAGYEIPAGVSARLDLVSGLEPVVFSTDVPLSIPPGSTTGTVAATGDRYTVDANGTAAGVRLEMIDSIQFVDRAELGSVVADGADPETDDEWIERGVQRFARLSETLVMPKHFEAAATENSAVVRVRALDNWNGSAGAPGDHPGWITVAVYGDGAPVSPATQDAIEADLDSRAAANLSVNVIGPTITTVNVTAQVKRRVGYDDATVQASVLAALNAYLDPGTWDWSGTVRRNELIAAISNVDGVDYVDTLTAPAADVVLSGYATLADLGTLTLTTLA